MKGDEENHPIIISRKFVKMGMTVEITNDFSLWKSRRDNDLDKVEWKRLNESAV